MQKTNHSIPNRLPSEIHEAVNKAWKSNRNQRIKDVIAKVYQKTGVKVAASTVWRRKPIRTKPGITGFLTFGYPSETDRNQKMIDIITRAWETHPDWFATDLMAWLRVNERLLVSIATANKYRTNQSREYRQRLALEIPR